MTSSTIGNDTVLNHRIDDLLLQARGLVLVREVLSRRGATRAELELTRASSSACATS